MKSIVSDGGPLVCLEIDVASLWKGNGENAPDLESLSDYKRACSIDSYLGQLPVGDRTALVLGDMPLETFIWIPAKGLPKVVRIFYGDPGVDVVRLLERGEELDFENPIESIFINLICPSLAVFDSAYPWGDSRIDRLFFELPVGRYLAMTKQFQLDDRTSVLVHAFEPSD